MNNNKINGIDVSEWELKGVLIPITECKYFEGIGDCKESKGLCVDNDNCYFKQLKRLEQENKELKNRFKTLDDEEFVYEVTEIEYNNFKKMNKYKQALEEIKEIANHEIKELTDSAIYGGRYFEIYNKINEVLNDRN